MIATHNIKVNGRWIRAGEEYGEKKPQPVKPAEPEKKDTKREELIRTIKFVLFSVSAGVIEIGVFTVLYELLHWEYWVAYLIALVLSVLWNFTLNRKFTFQSAVNVPVAMLKVACYYAVFTPLSTWWTAALTGENPFTGAAASAEPLVNNYVVQIGTMLINFVTEFLYQKFVVYRGTIDTNRRAQKKETSHE